MLFAPLVDAADPVEAGLERSQNRREERALTIEDARHVPAERLHQRDHDRAIKYDLNPADDGHCVKPFEFASDAAARRPGRRAGRSGSCPPRGFYKAETFVRLRTARAAAARR